eukprot:3863796-Rhodomonas_salina.1
MAVICDQPLVLCHEFIVNVCAQLMLFYEGVSGVYISTTGQLVRRVAIPRRPRPVFGEEKEEAGEGPSCFFTTGDGSVWMQSTEDGGLHKASKSEEEAIWLSVIWGNEEDGDRQDADEAALLPVADLADQASLGEIFYMKKVLDDDDASSGADENGVALLDEEEEGGEEEEEVEVGSSSRTTATTTTTTASAAVVASAASAAASSGRSGDNDERKTKKKKKKNWNAKAKKNALKRGRREERRAVANEEAETLAREQRYANNMELMRREGHVNVEDVVDSWARKLIASGVDGGKLDRQVLEIGNFRKRPAEGVRASAVLARMAMVVEVVGGKRRDGRKVEKQPYFMDTSVRCAADPFSAFNLVLYSSIEKVVIGMAEKLEKKRTARERRSSSQGGLKGGGETMTTLREALESLEMDSKQEGVFGLLGASMGGSGVDDEEEKADAKIASVFEGYHFVDASKEAENETMGELVAKWKAEAAEA